MLPKSAEADGPLGGASRFVEVLQVVVGISAAITAAVASFKSSPLVAEIAAGVLIASATWYAFTRHRARQRRPKLDVEALPSDSGQYFRGLLPFDKRDTLLGRSNDRSALVTKLRSRECRFACVSGEAGSGKTSLLRSAVIPALEEQGFVVFNVERTGADPGSAAVREIRRTTDGVAERATLAEALKSAAALNVGKPIIIIWDQFEEFFVARRLSVERQPFLRVLGEIYADRHFAVRMLIGIRKEFVDDLEEMSAWIEQPLDTRFWHRVRNWDTNQAAVVLDAAAEHDKVPFADALKETLISDLEHGGEVRPVEMQLVASRLVEQRIYDLDAYRAADGASGILQSYVSEIVRPPAGNNQRDFEVCARAALRLLCADNADTKRPVGLTFSEIIVLVQASAGSSIPSDIVHRHVETVIKRALNAFIVIQEDEERYNLLHDYIARPIFDATAGVQTVEQRANRALDHYLELSRSGNRVIIPRRDLRLIRRYATAQKRSEAAAIHLIRVSRHRHALEFAAACAGLLLVALVASPPRVEITSESKDVSHEEWIVSENVATALAFTASGSLRVWRVGTPFETAAAIPIPFVNVKVSGNGSWVAGITKAGDVYTWRADTPLRRDSKPAIRLDVPPSNTPEPDANWRFWHGWGSLSFDGKWIAAASGDGKVYLWHPGEMLAAGARPQFTMKIGGVFNTPPVVIFERTSRFVAVGDGYGNLALKGLRSVDDPVVRLPDYYLQDPSLASPGQVRFSEGWFFYPSGSRQSLMLSAAELAKYPEQPRVTHTALAQNAFNNLPEFAVSPDRRHLVYRPAFGDFRTWKINENYDTVAPPLIATKHDSGDRSAEIQFSSDGRWVAGIAADHAAYVWPADMTAGSAIAPVIPASRQPRQIHFSPSGKLIAVSSRNGETFVFAPGTVPRLNDPVATLASGSGAILWSSDEQQMMCLSGGDLYFGDSRKKIELLLRAKSPFQYVTLSDGGRRLVGICDHNVVSVVRRVRVLWFLTLKTMRWPPLESRSSLELRSSELADDDF